MRRDGGQIIRWQCENASAVHFVKLSINYVRQYQNDQLKKILHLFLLLC